MKAAILASGSGSNLQAIIDAAAADDGFGVELALVVSDRPSVKALDRAAIAGIPSMVIPWSGDRQAFTHEICEAVAAAGCEIVVLAGFMRILGTEAIVRFRNRILNVHPALLPSFPGAHAVHDALVHGAKVTGVTVHFVDEEVDHGAIVAQAAVEVASDDDEQSLHARIQVEEHRLLPAALKALGRGLLTIEGRVVRWRDV